MKQSKAAILVLLAGALWGSMGVFVRRLNAAGLYAMDVVLARMLSALLFMGIFMLLFSRESFRIRLKDLWCFLGSGIVSLLLFSLCYFSGMQEASLSVMAVLLFVRSDAPNGDVFRHAGYEPERHGSSALHLARDHHDFEHYPVP